MPKLSFQRRPDPFGEPALLARACKAAGHANEAEQHPPLPAGACFSAGAAAGAASALCSLLCGTGAAGASCCGGCGSSALPGSCCGGWPSAALPGWLVLAGSSAGSASGLPGSGLAGCVAAAPSSSADWLASAASSPWDALPPFFFFLSFLRCLRCSLASCTAHQGLACALCWP